MIRLIVAMDKNNVIGKDGVLPWHLPSDLKFFKETTMNETIVMGRKTFESIGKPLPYRNNVILTTNEDFQAKNTMIVHSLKELDTYVAYARIDDFFVIGGSELFKAFLPIADELYVTHIKHEFEGDTHFPVLNQEDWDIRCEVNKYADDKNEYDHTFSVYVRKY